MKYLVLYWGVDEYTAETNWMVYWYGIELKTGEKWFNKCKQEHRECKFVCIGKILKEQKL